MRCFTSFKLHIGSRPPLQQYTHTYIRTKLTSEYIKLLNERTTIGYLYMLYVICVCVYI